MWWLWLLGGLFAWFLVGLLAAVVVGRGVRSADLLARTSDEALPAAAFSGDPTEDRAPREQVTRQEPLAGRTRRRTVPLPAFGIVLVVVALVLETIGYVVQLTGSTTPAARLFSMDQPLSLPRLYVALLFAAAATAAVVAAGNVPRRRVWWLAVGAVAGGIAAVKAGSTIHSETLHVLNRAVGVGGGVLLSALAAAAVLAGLWLLSRAERRDRRRVLVVLALYAGASVGLSAVSSLAGDVFGQASTWAVGATFVEELSEALAGVALLVAVLVGVAPRVALPARWALRRRSDAYGLELPETLPVRPVEGPLTR